MAQPGLHLLLGGALQQDQRPEGVQLVEGLGREEGRRWERRRRTHLVSVLRYGDVAGLGGLDRRVEHVVGVEAQEDGVEHVGVDEGLERSRAGAEQSRSRKAKKKKEMGIN